jgi:uncharacterized membrane protein
MMERSEAERHRTGSSVVIEDRPAVSTTTLAGPTGDVAESEGSTLPRWVRLTGWTLLGLQMLVMLSFSTIQYSRYALTPDFANYAQAWWAIAHGHLDPYVTGFGASFWRDNAEFILYPLALLYYVDPHPIVLLWVQDVAVVATGLVAFRWTLGVIEDASRGQSGRIPKLAGPWLGVGAAVVLVVNPWAYQTIAFDFHFEPIAAFFCVLVAYNLWAGRIRRLWWLVPLALISHVLAGTYLVGIGLSGILAGRRTRGPGAVIAAVGLVWFVVFTSIGAAGVRGEYLSSSFGYLAGPHHGRVGLPAVVVGALGHPGAAFSVAQSHWTIVVTFLVIVGMIGILSPWGFGMALVVLVPNVLDASGVFIRFATSFQSWPAMPFVLVGSVTVLLRLVGLGATGRRIATVAAVVWATLLGEFAFLALPEVPRSWLSVNAPTAAELSRVATMIPANAEVISTGAVIGRFSQRQVIYPFSRPDQTIPVVRRQVVFIVTPHEILDDALSPPPATAAVSFIHHRLDARVLGTGSGVYAFAWSPSPGTIHVTLP